MQYIKLKKQAEEVDLFSDDEVEEGTQPISHEDYERLIQYLERKIHLLFFRFKLRIMPGSVSGKPVVLHGRTLTLRNNA